MGCIVNIAAVAMQFRLGAEPCAKRFHADGPSRAVVRCSLPVGHDGDHIACHDDQKAWATAARSGRCESCSRWNAENPHLVPYPVQFTEEQADPGRYDD